jgi:hypothetical protein
VRLGRPFAGIGGFGRIDLLAMIVWCGVAGLLISHFLSRSKTARQEALCQSNLQQVARAVVMYSDEHAKRLPGPSPSSSGGEQWWFYKEQVKGYLKLTGPSSASDTVFACPADRGYSESIPFYRTARFDYTSYVFNGVTLPRIPNVAGWPVSSVVSPAQTLLVMEWAAHAPLSWHRSRTGQKNAPFYRDAESMVAFTDGHAALTKMYYDGYSAAYTRDPIPGYKYRFSGN